jgi:hypothetical protein
MALPIPNLDNRTFEQLLQEARKSISNYAPQWTNHNPADPGITLIELFAWLAEITSYRINLVTEEHRLKYLKLLGIRPQGILPATVDLNFETEEVRYFEKGTVFLAEKAGKEIDFELSENINVIPISLEKIIVNEMPSVLSPASSLSFSQSLKLSKGVFDRSIANTKEDLFFAPFGLDTRKNSELYLGFNLKSQVNARESCNYPYKSLNFMCYLYEKNLIEPGKHGDEEDYEFENAKLKWEISLSPEGKQWKKVFPEDRTQNFRKTGSFLFTDLEGWVRSSVEVWPSPGNREKYFWLRCTLLESEYEYPPRIEKINMNTARVVQKKRVKDGILTESNGLPDQIFKLPETSVLRGSLKLTISGEEWKEVEDFDGSGPESPHFTLESLKGEIRFGDGLRGKVPGEGAEIRALEYETGRGEQGNLQANSRWVLKGEKVEGLTINNLKPATGGKGDESIDEAFGRFIRDMRIPYRAVTSEDFEYIARETPGLMVAQAKVIQNFDPYSQADMDGSVTVVIIPFSPLDTFNTLPVPSRDFREAVASHLEKHRLLGTRVHVVSPEYVEVKVKASLGISKGFFEEETRKKVLDKLNLFLHPVKGGTGGKGWPVGKPVYRSEIYRVIMETEGVDWVERIDIYSQKGAEVDENGDLKLASKIATVYSGEHSIEISGKGR